ncbi:Two-pore potassium channel 1 [Bienertia sinuspersici]
MEKQNNLKKPLLSEPIASSSQHQQKDETKKRFQRSRSAPLIVSLPGDHENVDHKPTPVPESLFKRLHPSCRRITMFLSIYLIAGSLCFYLVRDQLTGKKTNNSIVDALYFCMVTMTTVGYGDLVPQSTLSKLLACAFVFSGMALVGTVLSQGADYLVEKQEALIVRALESRKKLQPDDIMKEIETRKLRYKCAVVALILFILVISVLWILMSTICFAQFFLYLAELSTERRQNALVNWVLTRRVTIVDLEAADMDNDGVVEAAEFVLYKLKEMGKITQNDISLVMEQFEELDVDHSGTLSVYDLQHSAH